MLVPRCKSVVVNPRGIIGTSFIMKWKKGNIFGFVYGGGGVNMKSSHPFISFPPSVDSIACCWRMWLCINTVYGTIYWPTVHRIFSKCLLFDRVFSRVSNHVHSDRRNQQIFIFSHFLKHLLLRRLRNKAWRSGGSPPNPVWSKWKPPTINPTPYSTASSGGLFRWTTFEIGAWKWFQVATCSRYLGYWMVSFAEASVRIFHSISRFLCSLR